MGRAQVRRGGTDGRKQIKNGRWSPAAIRISQVLDEDTVNGNQVESARIGLDNVSAMMQNMDGRCDVEKERDQFRLTLRFPCRLPAAAPCGGQGLGAACAGPSTGPLF